VSEASPFSVSEMLARLAATVNAKGPAIFDRGNHSDEAADVGLTMPEARVLLCGNPTASRPLMIASPLLVLAFPLCALVWQDRAKRV